MTVRGDARTSADGRASGTDPEAWRVGDRVPDAVHAPASVEEVARILREASREGRRIVPAGAAPAVSSPGAGPGKVTSGAGAGEERGREPADAPASWSILSTALLEGISEYEPANLTITAGAGTLLSDLESATAAQGQWLPVDPPGMARTTLGALLATGASGPLRAGFGRVRDHALGITFVTGDGRIVHAGGRVVKNVAGYDLVRLMVGSRGRLGVITSATLRLYPVPAEDRTLVFELPTVEDAAVLALRYASLPFPVAALDVVDPGSPAPPRVALRIVGSVAAVEETARALRVGGRWEEASQLRGKKSARFFRQSGDVEARAPFVLAVGCPPARLREAVALVQELRRRGVAVHFKAHAATGEIRVMLEELPDSGRWLASMGDFRSRLSEAGMASRVIREPAPAVGNGAGEGTGASGGGNGASDPPLRGVSRIERGLKQAFDPMGVLP